MNTALLSVYLMLYPIYYPDPNKILIKNPIHKSWTEYHIKNKKQNENRNK